jgi:hypothetical protein
MDAANHYRHEVGCAQSHKGNLVKSRKISTIISLLLPQIFEPEYPLERLSTQPWHVVSLLAEFQKNDHTYANDVQLRERILLVYFITSNRGSGSILGV